MRMSKLLVLCVLLWAAGLVVAQKERKPWKEWSKREAESMLKDSPWAHPQADMDQTEANKLNRSRIVGTGDEDVRTRMNEERVFYIIRLLSARPIRQAFVRVIQLQNKDYPVDVIERLNAFADKPAEDLIVVAVTVEGPDSKPIEKVMQVLRGASAGTLQSGTYLLRSDGKRNFLSGYTPPGKDGFGARFIFPRTMDGKPFLTPEFSSVRFIADLGSSIKFDMTYKVKDMLVAGDLEY